MDGLPRDAQIAWLDSVVDQYDTIGPQIGQIIAAWRKGDAEALGRLMTADMKDDPRLVETLLTRRNATWAKWIEARLKQPGTVFVAVGAGHLAGKGSVQDDLAQRHHRHAGAVSHGLEALGLAALALLAAACHGGPAAPACQSRAVGNCRHSGTRGWIFGTVHALPAGVQWRRPAIDRALANADRLVLEIAQPLDGNVAGVALARLAYTPGLPPLGPRGDEVSPPGGTRISTSPTRSSATRILGGRLADRRHRRGRRAWTQPAGWSRNCAS
jgi:uncharacterized protein YbaP (TraB family)